MAKAKTMYELIIIGSGPSGLSASIYASRYKINHIIIGESIGGLAWGAHKIGNWPSEIEISGTDLVNKMKDHVSELKTEIIPDKVVSIKKQDNIFVLETQSGKKYETKTVIIATGTKPRKLNIENEEKFTGKGISYCATCDGPFFKNKTVAVLGGGNSAMTAALYLSELANKVYIIYRGESFKGEMTWIDKIKNNEKITVLYNTKVIDFIGDTKIQKIKIDNTFEGSDEIELDGVFIEIGGEPDLEIAKDLDIEINNSRIKINPDQSTNIAGVWASGDVTDGSNNFRQLITACSEGAIASDSIHKYLSLNK